MLDALRGDAIERCELLLDQMDDMYALLMTVGDLTFAAQQQRLVRRLEALGPGP